MLDGLVGVIYDKKRDKDQSYSLKVINSLTTSTIAHNIEPGKHVCDPMRWLLKNVFSGLETADQW